MSESASALMHKTTHLPAKMAANGSAGAATLLPIDTFGQFLNAHGVWLLSYAEWIKVVGAIWISILIIETIGKYIKKIIERVKK